MDQQLPPVEARAKLLSDFLIDWAKDRKRIALHYLDASDQMTGEVVTPGDLAEVTRIARKIDGKSDLWTPLAEAPPGRRNPKAEAVTATRRVWADLDPPEALWNEADGWTGDRKEWLNKVFARAMEMPEKLGVSPSVFLDSGRGVWIHIELAEPWTDLDAAEAANRGLLEWFSHLTSDKSGWARNKIGRLPYLINTKTGIPGSATRLPGDPQPISALAGLLRLAKAKDVGAKVAPAATTGYVVEVDPAAREQVEVEALLQEYGLDGKWAQVITSGEGDAVWASDRATEGKDNSRSGWMFAAVLAMVSKEVPDQTIYDVLTDPTLAISDAIRITKKGKRLSPQAAHNYAVRQIAKAKDLTVNPLLAEMNEQFFVVPVGSKTRVAYWDESETHPGVDELHFFQRTDFENLHNQTVQVDTTKDGKPIFAPKGAWWFSNNRRRQYRGVRLMPEHNAEVVNGYYNLWSGWSVNPEPGDWSLYRRLLEDVICSGKAEWSDYLLRWLAWGFQNPGEPHGVAFVMRGDRGVGKGTFVRPLRQVFGPHFLHSVNMSDLTGDFNGHTDRTLLHFLDEAVVSGAARDASIIKGAITEATRMEHKKFTDKRQVRNRISYILATNNDWAIPAGPAERRFFAVDVPNELPDGTVIRQNKAFFEPVHDQIDRGGAAAMLFDLLALDLDGWHPREGIPKTDLLREQAERSQHVEVQWLIDLAERGVIPGAIFPDWPAGRETERPYQRGNLPVDGWLDSLREYAGPGARLPTPRQLGYTLTKWGFLGSTSAPGDRPLKVKLGGAEDKTRRPPPLDWLRRQIDREFGAREWPEVECDRGQITDGWKWEISRVPF